MLKLFSKTPIDTMTDGALRREADRVEQVKAELARREQAKAEATAAKEAAEAAREKERKIAAHEKRHALLLRARADACTALDAAIVAVAAAHAERDRAQERLWRGEHEGTALGAPAPASPIPGLSPDAVEAARAVIATLLDEVGAASPFRSTVATQIATAGGW